MPMPNAKELVNTTSWESNFEPENQTIKPKTGIQTKLLLGERE